MGKISPLSWVEPGAQLADDVFVGPFCHVGPRVVLGAGCRLISHVSITGKTRAGKANVFFPNCVIGSIPQDKKFRGAETCLEIGDDNCFREAASVHLGTERGGGVTRIGNGNLLMVNVHIGHDASIGNRCIIANNSMIAGHVVCGNFVNMMGAVGIHHFVTVGDFAYLGGAARIHHDVPPFVKVDGADEVRGVNTTGLRRSGFSESDIEALEEACRKLFYRRKPFARAMAEFDMQNGINPHVKQMLEFLRRRDTGKHGRYLEGLRK